MFEFDDKMAVVANVNQNTKDVLKRQVALPERDRSFPLLIA